MSTSRRARSEYLLNKHNRKIITFLEGRSLIRDAKGRYRESPLVTEKHRNVLRPLFMVLEELMDENVGKDAKNTKGINYSIIQSIIIRSTDLLFIYHIN